MTIYIALLRGINVGGHRKIKMEDLRNTFERLDFDSVQTYIQSGNVLFKSDDEEGVLQERIEHAIEVDFGFTVSVVLRTAQELRAIHHNCPFSEELLAKAKASSVGQCLYVSMFIDAPSQGNLDKLSEYKSDQELFHVEGRDMYLLFYQSIRNSKLTNQLPKFDITGTIRNWKTLSKLVAIADEIESTY